MTDRPEAGLLRRIAESVDDVGSVIRRSTGLIGNVGSYLPGERIDGVRVRGDRLELHVVMSWDSTVDEVESEVLAAVGSDWETGRIDLVIDDIAAHPPPEVEAGSTT